MAASKSPCQAEGKSHAPCANHSACAIQDCLAKNNNNSDKCLSAQFKLYACCYALYQRDAQATSPCCPSPSQLNAKRKEFPKEMEKALKDKLGDAYEKLKKEL